MIAAPTSSIQRGPLAVLGAAVVAFALSSSAASAGSIPTGTPEEVGMSSERLERINEVVARHIDAGDVAGVVTLVARRGRIVHHEAAGMMDIASGTPMRRDAIFRLASMSKPIVAVSVMMLIEEGKISLTDPVSRFIPEFAGLDEVALPKANGADGYDVVPAERPITIRDLLTHTSGLMTAGGPVGAAANRLAPRTPDDTLATYIPKLANVPLDYQPGTRWRYSGLAGFDVLSRVVEVASGLPFDEFLDERLFGPLGMTDTGFYFDAERERRLPTMYSRTRDGRLEAQRRPLDRVFFSGAGGLASSAEDYLKLAQMLLNGGELDGVRILGPRTIERMVANHTGDMVNGQFGRPAAGMGFGLGMQVVLDPVAADLAVSKGAYSWPGGTGVSFWVEPAEQLVSIFMIQGGSAGELRRGFENAVRQAIIE